MDKDILLSVSGLKVKFDNHVVLNDVSFDVKRDETLAVIGPNGAGKSVLFRALLGLVPFQGKIVWRLGTKIGYVPQKLSIGRDLPITTEEFFALKEKDKKKVKKALEAVGFEENKPHEGHLVHHILKRKLGVLSGGELQRVLIAWAIIGDPDVLLFDEPTAGVDISSEESIYGLLHKLQAKRALTILLISHELQIVYRYANNVICLNKEKLCFGPPSQVLDKSSLAKLYGSDTGYYEHHHANK